MHSKQSTSRPRPVSVGARLSLFDALRARAAGTEVRWTAASRRRVARAAQRIQRAVASQEWVYGVTTGFGSNAGVGIAAEDGARLQENLLLSHALGDGPPLPDSIVRLALLLRIHALAQGHSGIRPATIEQMLALYTHDILPEVPERGSVGASGDLAPLSYLALPVIGHGWVHMAGRRLRARTALSKAGLAPLTLTFKEGLALINGMQISLSVGLHALAEARTLVITADVAAALTTEALAGRSAALDPRIHEVRRHPGQQASAARIRGILRGSRLVDAPHGALEGKRRAPQDSYGIRCAPQVHGASSDGIDFAASVFAREIDAVTDNPLIFDEDILSGGNFHGQPVALAADHLKLSIHELGSISERRLATLVDPHMNEGLPAYLAPKAGLHSGFMIPQYVAAALSSESKTLCFPASADSIPTGANVEDHVSMAPIAARRAREVADRVTSILALELMGAAQAIDLRPRRAGRRSRAVMEAIREVVDFRSEDAPWEDALVRMRALVRDGDIARAAGLGRELHVPA